ncbi:MAG: FUSC family protein [Bacteroidetes bacterium]|nr:FUSC family protein [Bacteroidota bacterium]
MKQEELSALSDEELLERAKKMKSASIINAVLIGFMIGIVIYSLVKNTFGFLMLIPLYLAFRVFHNPQKDKALKEVLKARNLS